MIICLGCMRTTVEINHGPPPIPPTIRCTDRECGAVYASATQHDDGSVSLHGMILPTSSRVVKTATGEQLKEVIREDRDQERAIRKELVRRCRALGEELSRYADVCERHTTFTTGRMRNSDTLIASDAVRIDNLASRLAFAIDHREGLENWLRHLTGSDNEGKQHVG